MKCLKARIIGSQCYGVAGKDIAACNVSTGSSTGCSTFYSTPRQRPGKSSRGWLKRLGSCTHVRDPDETTGFSAGHWSHPGIEPVSAGQAFVSPSLSLFVTLSFKQTTHKKKKKQQLGLCKPSVSSWSWTTPEIWEPLWVLLKWWPLLLLSVMQCASCSTPVLSKPLSNPAKEIVWLPLYWWICSVTKQESGLESKLSWVLTFGLEFCLGWEALSLFQPGVEEGGQKGRA